SARACASGDLSTLGALAGFSPLPSFSLSAIDLNSRALGDPPALAVCALAGDFEAHARRLAVLRIRERDVRQVKRQLLGDDAALLLRRLFLVALDHVDAAHGRPLGARIALDHLAAASLVAAGQHD